MKKVLQITIITIALMVGIPSVSLALEAFPAFPMSFWGNVSINGVPVPAGTVVRAYYGSVLVGTVTVQEMGVYGYTEPAKQKMVLSEGVGPVTFSIQTPGINGGVETGGATAMSHPTFEAGTTINKNLTFTINVATSGGGGSGSSSSGGGGGGNVSVISQITKGDATGDGKVNILDFNTFLVQWGRAGAGFAADFDGNAKVNIFDFNLLLINWTN